MRKITLLTLFILIATTSKIFAQERKNVVKMNLFSLAAATFNFAYERALNEKTSVQLDVAYTGVSSGGVKYSGYQIQPEVRFYFSQKGAPSGFYLAPFARYRSLGVSAQAADVDAYGNVTTVTDKMTWNSVGGGLVLGGQWLLGGRVALGVFGGPAYYAHSFKYEGSANSSNFNIKGGTGGFSFRSGLTLGVAF
jgi:hypothetical protein